MYFVILQGYALWLQFDLKGWLRLFIYVDYYTLAEGILISVRSLQRSEGDVSDPIKYIYS